MLFRQQKSYGVKVACDDSRRVGAVDVGMELFELARRFSARARIAAKSFATAATAAATAASGIPRAEDGPANK